MSYFDNANTNVTRKSFGSKVDKTFQREGVIPVKNRKKEEIDYVAESARFNELNKKVESRRLNELKESRAYNIALNEGYDKLKDSLIKDFMSQICVESLLIDEEVVNNNLRNIVSLVEEQVDDLGGFNGIKQIAESTNNPLLQNMINVCEEVCKNVGKRNIKEANGEAKKLSFELNKDEMNDFDYRKQAVGIETIVDNIKDKVFQVVQDEQKMNSDKKEVMNEIEGKIQELEAPVQEAMEFIFGSKIEETTLFDSLMRSRYSQIIESSCSSIFESIDPDDEDNFEDQEFSMSEIEIDNDIEDEIDDDDITNFYAKEAGDIIDSIYNGSSYDLEKALESVVDSIEETTKSCKVITDAKKCKESIREIQKSTEDIVEEAKCKDKRSCEACKPRKKSKMKEVSESKKLSVNDIFSLMEARCGKKKTCEANEDKEIVPSVNDTVEETGCKTKEELVMCPYCETDPCVCDEVITEGLTLDEFKTKLKSFFDDLSSRKLSKEDFNKLRPQFIKLVSLAKKPQDCDDLEKDVKEGVQQLEKAKHKYPNLKDKLQDQIDWLNNNIKNKIKIKRKELEKKQVVESFITKLDDICESLTNVIEAHEIAYNNVLESLTYEIDNKSTLVPYLQTKDCNLTNLEFAYKTKLVCESLKDGLKHAANENEAMVIERAIELNITSINESLDAIKDIEKMNYKSTILESGKKYLTKLQYVINNNTFPNKVTESTSVFNSIEDVDKIFNSVKEYAVIESTDGKLMEMVMSEAIVEYTIMEAFNTLKLTKYDKDTVRGISRRNINK